MIRKTLSSFAKPNKLNNMSVLANSSFNLSTTNTTSFKSQSLNLISGMNESKLSFTLARHFSVSANQKKSIIELKDNDQFEKLLATEN